MKAYHCTKCSLARSPWRSGVLTHRFGSRKDLVACVASDFMSVTLPFKSESEEAPNALRRCKTCHHSASAWTEGSRRLFAARTPGGPCGRPHSLGPGSGSRLIRFQERLKQRRLPTLGVAAKRATAKETRRLPTLWVAAKHARAHRLALPLVREAEAWIDPNPSF